MSIKNLLPTIILLIIISTSTFSLIAKKISIKDFFTENSLYSQDTYDILLEAHIKAIEENAEIDYSGIDTIRLTIPPSAIPIPLPNIIDFQNVVFIITNTTKNITLFELHKDMSPLPLSESDFANIREFENRRILLAIKDENPWVKERTGYGSQHIRQDIVVLDDGNPCNQTIQPYDNASSQPSYSYRVITEDSIRINNLIVHRSEESTNKTFCMRIQNAHNIGLTNISVITPKSDLYGDAILTFNNCSKVTLNDIYIDGTYSQKDKYGYGIAMNNVYDSRFKNIYGDGDWGIFGTNNINQVHIENSNINRFDIHCYGKDVYCKNTVFRNLYNQFSSFYGNLIYENCQFSRFVPVFIENTYSAYTLFNVNFKNCMIIVDPKRPYLMDMRHSTLLNNSVRPELRSVEWPNLIINNLYIESTHEVNNYTLYHTVSNRIINIGNDLRIQINGIFGNFNMLKLSNSKVVYKD